MRDGGRYETIRGLANKLPEHAARIATVLEALALCVKTKESSSSSSKKYSGPTVSATALASAMTVVALTSAAPPRTEKNAGC